MACVSSDFDLEAEIASLPACNLQRQRKRTPPRSAHDKVEQNADCVGNNEAVGNEKSCAIEDKTFKSMDNSETSINSSNSKDITEETKSQDNISPPKGMYCTIP